MPFTYVNVTTKGYKGAINLFFNDHVIASVVDVDVANEIRKEIPEYHNDLETKEQFECSIPKLRGFSRPSDWDKPYGYHTMKRHG